MEFTEAHRGIRKTYITKEQSFGWYRIDFTDWGKHDPVRYEVRISQEPNPPLGVIGVYWDGHPRIQAPQEVIDAIFESDLPIEVKQALGLEISEPVKS